MNIILHCDEYAPHWGHVQFASSKTNPENATANTILRHVISYK